MRAVYCSLSLSSSHYRRASYCFPHAPSCLQLTNASSSLIHSLATTKITIGGSIAAIVLMVAGFLFAFFGHKFFRITLFLSGFYVFSMSNVPVFLFRMFACESFAMRTAVWQCRQLLSSRANLVAFPPISSTLHRHIGMDRTQKR